MRMHLGVSMALVASRDARERYIVFSLSFGLLQGGTSDRTESTDPPQDWGPNEAGS